MQAMVSTAYEYWATRGTAYHAAKDAAAEAVLDKLTRHFPGVRSAVRVTDVATPHRYWRSRSWRTPPIFPVPLELTSDKHVILAAPIWNAKIAAPMRTFANHAHAAIGSYSFVTLCAGREGQETKLRAELQRFVGKPPLQLLQLEARELLPRERRKGREPSKYRVHSLDLTYFAPQLDRFVHMLRR